MNEEAKEHVPAVVDFDQGGGNVRPASVVGHRHDPDNGTLVVDVFAPEGDGDDVKFFSGIPEGTGGMTFSRQ